MSIKNQNRKEFLKTASSATLISILGLSFTNCSDSSTGSEEEEPLNGLELDGFVVTVDLSHPNFESLNSEGGTAISTIGGFLAVNIDGTTIRAFTNFCTHNRCNDQWSTSGTDFICNCHGSRFNNKGVPTQGPAQADLTEFSVSRDGSSLIINKNP
ncbi:MAG: Rieske 2Fe-2S domain-containing protein [Balneolaceae bacterium]